jgi:hypothetical protein
MKRQSVRENLNYGRNWKTLNAAKCVDISPKPLLREMMLPEFDNRFQLQLRFWEGIRRQQLS